MEEIVNYIFNNFSIFWLVKFDSRMVKVITLSPFSKLILGVFVVLYRYFNVKPQGFNSFKRDSFRKNEKSVANRNKK